MLSYLNSLLFWEVFTIEGIINCKLFEESVSYVSCKPSPGSSHRKHFSDFPNDYHGKQGKYSCKSASGTIYVKGRVSREKLFN